MVDFRDITQRGLAVKPLREIGLGRRLPAASR
jgi:hypothetical protein